MAIETQQPLESAIEPATHSAWWDVIFLTLCMVGITWGTGGC